MIHSAAALQKKLKLSAIAKKAGVSIATVSNVINGKGRMSRDTVSKVHRVIEELTAANADTHDHAGKNGTIALISVDPTVMINHSSFHMQLIQGMQTVLERTGHLLTLATCLTPEEFAAHTRGAAAAVVVGFPEHPEAFVRASGVPFIWALRSTSVAADVVQEDNREIARIAANHLIDRGHRVIGYIDDLRVESLGERGAFLAAFAHQRGCAVVSRSGQNLFTAGPESMSIDEDQTRRLLRELLDASPRPSALFIPGDRLCVTVYHLLQEMGVRPQSDIEILSCNNDIPYLKSLFPRPATVGMNIDVIGRRAAELAIWRMNNPDEPTVRVLIQPTLILPPH